MKLYGGLALAGAASDRLRTSADWPYEGAMKRIATWASPWGRTTRAQYWLVSAVLAFGFAVIWANRDALGLVPSAVQLVAINLFYAVTTVRRLHDAGFSRWWAALCLFPMSITLDLFQMRVGGSTVQFVDISTVIRMIPMLIGLTARTRTFVDPLPLRSAHRLR